MAGTCKLSEVRMLASPQLPGHGLIAGPTFGENGVQRPIKRRHYKGHQGTVQTREAAPRCAAVVPSSW